MRRSAEWGVGREMRDLGERLEETIKVCDELTDENGQLREERDTARAQVRELTRQLHEARQTIEGRGRTLEEQEADLTDEARYQRERELMQLGALGASS